MAEVGKVIKVQKMPRKEARPEGVLDSLDELCLYYPAYDLEKARRLPRKHVQRMLRNARRLQAARYYNLTQIAASPYSENGKGVQELLSKYQEDMNV